MISEFVTLTALIRKRITSLQINYLTKKNCVTNGSWISFCKEVKSYSKVTRLSKEQILRMRTIHWQLWNTHSKRSTCSKPDSLEHPLWYINFSVSKRLITQCFNVGRRESRKNCMCAETLRDNTITRVINTHDFSFITTIVLLNLDFSCVWRNMWRKLGFPKAITPRKIECGRVSCYNKSQNRALFSNEPESWTLIIFSKLLSRTPVRKDFKHKLYETFQLFRCVFNSK